MKKITLLLSLAVAVACVGWSCKSRTLEAGGAYNPAVTNYSTNVDGQVTIEVVPIAAPQKILFIADESYKFAYETVLSVFKFERDNRAQIYAVSPRINKAMNKARLEVQAIDLRWANARSAYKANPTPAGLDTIHQILGEIQRILPIIQGELTPYYQSLAKPQ